MSSANDLPTYVPVCGVGAWARACAHVLLLPCSKFVEVVGTVNPDGTVTEVRTSMFGDKFGTLSTFVGVCVSYH